MSRWPSRRLQIGAIVVLAIGAAIQVSMPPMTRQARAERLYLDGWFECSVPKLEEALDLDPGNSMYEQALVWRYDRDKLPRLLKTRRLGKEAQALAAGLIYQHEIESIEDPKRKLVLVDALIKADPTNALPHYRKAALLEEMGRPSLAELRRGNACGKMRFYSPTVTDRVLNSSQSPIMQPMFSDYAKSRGLTRAIVDQAHVSLREGKVEESATMMEDCLRMSVILSSAEPPTTIGVLVGIAMQKIATFTLEPVCKDFGMENRLVRVKRLDRAYERALKACKDENAYSSLDHLTLIIAIPFTIVWLGGSAAGLLLLSFLSWILPAIRRRGQPAINLGLWNQGWIARASLLISVPLMVAAALLGDYALGYADVRDGMGPYAFLIVLGSVIVLVLGLRMLHHRHDESTGEKTVIFRFIFKSPANVKAWTRKSLMLLFGGQLAFAACFGLLAIILCKPLLGGQPWQINRFHMAAISHEETTMRRVGDDLRKAYFYR
ncbi:MAG TPA: hypothetical protein VFI02_13935 [Armatimonadota bacterium]|nr:hypothetical protein [Armatimonadota bacterium]